MGFYQGQIVPLLTNLAMRNKHLAAYRDRVVPAAAGRVLEVGIGSGLNLPRYSSNVQQVIGLEPSPKLLGMARNAERRSFPVDLIEGSAEEIPLEKGSVDTVVTTWTLCTIPDAAVRSMKCVVCSNQAVAFCSLNMGGRPIPTLCGGRTG
jgi:ubiquinone/menaquinone biosynthesis C-methylase UbiE